jgi:Fe-S cluster biogenesis protein NfuA
MSNPKQLERPPGDGGNRVFIIVLAVLGGLLVLCGGLCAGCLVIARTASQAIQKEAESALQEINERRVELEQELATAYAGAIMAAEAHPVVVERIGKPIELGDPHRIAREGQLDPSGEQIQFDIEGPKGKGVISAIAVKEGDVWRATQIKVTFDNAETIEVPPLPGK